MKILRSWKVELDPTNQQRTNLARHAGAARWAWNWGLSRRIEEYKTTKKSSRSMDQHKQLVQLKKTEEYAWLREVSKCAPLSALRNLDQAYNRFWKGQARFPKFKSRKRSRESFRMDMKFVVFNQSIKLLRLGTIRLKEHGYIPTSGVHYLSATCSSRAGRWFVSVNAEVEIPDPRPATGDILGVDLGIKTLAVLSDGRTFENPKPLDKMLKRLRRLQRELARRKEGGKNYQKTKDRIAKLHWRIANLRRDTLHKATSAVCAITKPDNRRPCAVVLEDLNVAGMTRNHKLARAISDTGFSEFRRQVDYKTQWNGEQLVIADRFFPSSKTCSACGQVNQDLTLGDRSWACVCGATHDRDLNAALNLKEYGLRTVGQTGTYARGDLVRPVPLGAGGIVESGIRFGASAR